jgi:hypothetical protein
MSRCGDEDLTRAGDHSSETMVETGDEKAVAKEARREARK